MGSHVPIPAPIGEHRLHDIRLSTFAKNDTKVVTTDTVLIIIIIPSTMMAM